jgi:hypothetical protein
MRMSCHSLVRFFEAALAGSARVSVPALGAKTVLP